MKRDYFFTIPRVISLLVIYVRTFVPLRNCSVSIHPLRKPHVQCPETAPGRHCLE